MNYETKICTSLKFSCLLHMSTTKKVSEKHKVHALFVRSLQIIHPGSKFESAPIVVGTVGYVPKCLVTCLKKFGFKRKEIKLIIRRTQVKSICCRFAKHF